MSALEDYRAYREAQRQKEQARRELESLSDTDLLDMGIARCNIETVIKGYYHK